MHIQSFISEHAPEGHRLQAALQDAVAGVPVMQHKSPGDVGREVRASYNKKNIAVIMVAEHEELVELARLKNTWDRLWTILVLPDSEPETVTLGHAIRPRFMTFAESDFGDVVAVLKNAWRKKNDDIRN